MSIYSMSQEILDGLDRQGIVTSLAFGTLITESSPRWSVSCMKDWRHDFGTYYRANDLLEACQIALAECINRGWVSAPVVPLEKGKP